MLLLFILSPAKNQYVMSCTANLNPFYATAFEISFILPLNLSQTGGSDLHT